MSLVWVYLLVLLLILLYLVLQKKKEFFETSISTSVVIEPTSTSLEPNITTSIVTEDTINFSIIDDSEKAFRDKEGEQLDRCLGKYINRNVGSLKDVSELMYSKIDDCDIYKATEVKSFDNGKFYLDKMTYW